MVFDVVCDVACPVVRGEGAVLGERGADADCFRGDVLVPAPAHVDVVRDGLGFVLARPVVRHGLRARVQRLCSFAVGEDDGRVAHEVPFSCFAADEGDGQAVLIGCLFEVEFELLAAGGDGDVLDDQGPVAVAGDPGAVDLVVAHRYFMVGCLVRVVRDHGAPYRLAVVPRGDGRAVRAARGAARPFWRADRAHDGVREKIFR